MLADYSEITTNLSTSEVIVKSLSLQNCNLHQLQLMAKDKLPFLLETVAISQAKEVSESYSILFAYPQAEHRLYSADDSIAFYDKFQQDFYKNKQNITIKLPFYGGWFCYFSYDYAQVVEPSLNIPTSDLPLAILTRVPCAFIYEHKNKVLHLVAEVAYANKLDSMEQMLKNITAPFKHNLNKNKLNIYAEDESKYLFSIKKIKEYILSGDIFQVNLSRIWHAKLTNWQVDLVYEALKQTNPAPFAANVYFKEFQIISSSPERLVKYDNNTGWVEVRPIAGTRKRSQDLTQDRALIAELLSHPKEIAEHIMLIDLERNDLGRICQIGSVEVNELMTIETYQHVHHIVSNIRGKLKNNISPLDIINAVFPGGTITGCPKIRCIEIIAELEETARDAYTGSIGYINCDGSMDTNILIRTIMLQNNVATFRAGAGIVADSIDVKELEESKHKAKGLIQALDSI